MVFYNRSRFYTRKTPHSIFIWDIFNIIKIRGDIPGDKVTRDKVEKVLFLSAVLFCFSTQDGIFNPYNV